MTSAHRLHERCAASALASAPFALAGTERRYERARPFLVRHTVLDLSLDFEERSVTGTARLSIARVVEGAETMALDAIGFELGSVRVIGATGARDVGYEYDGATLRVHGLTESELTLEVSYRAVPRRGLYFLAPDPKVKDRPVQVWTQCQDEDARHWFPCHDKPHVKMTTEIRVAVPKGFVALSNGEPVESKASKGATSASVFHFKLDKPHPSYLVTLVVGKFDIVEDRPAVLEDGREIKVVYYVPQGRRGDAKRSFGQTPRMIELFSKVTGVPFPWSRYSQVVVSDFVFGGMENTTATTMYEHVMVDARAELDISSHDLVAHELAHQWFGDFVTCRDWPQAWLNEGFATYFEHVEREDRLGRDEYDYGVATDMDTYLSEASGRYQRPIVCREYHEPIDLFDRHLYEKGGLVLHMLRRKLSDSAFFAGIKHYLSAHAHGLVETVDLQRALEQSSGLPLDRFFDQWVLRPGHPELKVKVGYEDELLTVSVKQAQKGNDVTIFDFDFEIEVRSADGDVSRHRKHITSAQESLVVKLPKRPSYVGIDPELRVVGSLSLDVPNDLLKNQLEHGSSARLRWAAAEALAKKPDITSVAALGRVLGNEDELWMVRAEAARALGKTRLPDAQAALAERTHVGHPKVRRAVASALGAFKNETSLKALLPLAKKDASFLVESEAARSLGKTRQAAALKPLLGMLERDSWGDVVRQGALDGLGALRDEGGLDAVRAHTEYGHPTRGRRSAISALAELGEGKHTREALEALLEDADPHLRIEVINALVRFADPKSRGALRRTLDHELDGRVVRRLREALRDLSDGSGERKRVNDELESLRNELSELKHRLSELEEKKKPIDEKKKPTDEKKKQAESHKPNKPTPRKKAKSRRR
ncbi:MAG TPA: M1 family aminopeptidase [Polyangiaceae bacterium]|nr:M1 family aminopeptidase [Polyangiaceae bacterium]